MIRVENLQLRGTSKLHAGEGKTPFVWLAYASGVFVIPTSTEGVEIKVAFQSVELRLWPNGFDALFPQTAYTASNGETRRVQKVRPADRESRVEFERALKRQDAIQKLIEEAAQLLS